jgi:phospholipase/carboxylesterase
MATALLLAALLASPANARDAYNLACRRSLAGEKDAAVEALGLAADLGFAFTATLLRDPDLDPIRGHPGYAPVLARVRANNARALEAFKVRAGKAKVLVFPPARARPDSKTPLIVALHGSGGTADQFARLWRGVASRLGAVLAVPQGLNPAGAGFDWGVVEQGSHLVLRAIERARMQAAVDDTRVVLAGFSNGASQAFILGLQQPETFAGIVPIAGFYDERVAPVPAGRRLPRFAILNGEKDRDAANNRLGAAALEAAGGNVLLKIYPGLGHAFPPHHEQELEAALEFVLGPGGP